VDVFRLRCTEHLDAVAVDMQAVAVHPHLAGEAPVGGVEPGQILDAGLVGQVVQGDDLHVLATALMQGAQHAPPDPAVAVQGDAIGSGGGHAHSSSSSSSATSRMFSTVKPNSSNS